jgi:DNA-binding transcriptional regulator GbsR (MarR family)
MEQLNKRLIEIYQEMGRGQGLSDSLLMELFARIYIEPEPIAMDELARKTGYSLASISNKVKMLAPMMGIKKVKKPGSKKIFLYMDKDFIKIWKNALLKKEQYVISLAKERFPLLIKEFRNKAKTDKDKKKLKVIEDYYEQILVFEGFMKKMLNELNKIE